MRENAAMTTLRVLVVDNDDSFVHILCDQLAQRGAEIAVVRSRDVAHAERALAGFDGVLVSPGPGAPRDAGASLSVVAAAAERRLPLLGVCLGHQVIAEAYGARVEIAPELVHGSSSAILHDGRGVFADVGPAFEAGRYHSLAVVESTLPPELSVTARTAEGVVMGIRHERLPIEGVQFHPESVLTPEGPRLLDAWLRALLRPEATSPGYSSSAGGASPSGATQ